MCAVFFFPPRKKWCCMKRVSGKKNYLENISNCIGRCYLKNDLSIKMGLKLNVGIHFCLDTLASHTHTHTLSAVLNCVALHNELSKWRSIIHHEHKGLVALEFGKLISLCVHHVNRKHTSNQTSRTKQHSHTFFSAFSARARAHSHLVNTKSHPVPHTQTHTHSKVWWTRSRKCHIFWWGSSSLSGGGKEARLSFQRGCYEYVFCISEVVKGLYALNIASSKRTCAHGRCWCRSQPF